MSHTARIHLAPGRAVVEIDGHDVAQGLVGLRVDAQAGGLPEITLYLAAHEVTDFESEQAVILLPESTADALKALGWTPPEGSR